MSDREPESQDRSERVTRSPAPRLSRSKRSPSRIYRDGEEKLSVDPTEIDEIITNYYETKLQLKELEAKEQRYKRMIHRLLDVTRASQIKGRALEVSRRTQRRRIITRKDCPREVFDQYSREMVVPMLFVRAL